MIASRLRLVAVTIFGILPTQAQDPKWSTEIAQAEQLYERRQFSAAIVKAEKALRIAEKQVGHQAPELTSILKFLGAFDEKPNGNRRAIVYLRREESILRKQNGPVAKQQLVDSLFGLGQSCQIVRDLTCAINSYEQAIAAAEPLEASPENLAVHGLQILARLRGERKEFPKAETLMRRYLDIRERAPKHLKRHLEIDYEFAAQDFANWHNDAEALRLYEWAIREAKAQKDADRNPNVAFLLGRAASFLISLTRYDQAQSLLDEASVVLRAAGEVHGAAQIYGDKAAICKLLGDRTCAMAFLEQANQALKTSPPGIVIEPYTYERLPNKPSLARHGI